MEVWTGPDGLRVTAVPLDGAHRAWADFAGVPADATSAFLATRRGLPVGRGWYASIAELSEQVDLASLTPA
ncbi:hypothetical protein DZF91_04060 [Actinomadura logoneensis]|uniref:GNAT family N-acetyltransferase n=1 Tax=Actinomadura logoneensis TaxID=2293572 RepID=A0A372JSA7_9ACTN|nr:hypothetical protein [Actinomadura logoneensis]RFU42897.1 hypothetical protein DZF91_04060 [Actinomadura logoneensis]